MRHQKPYEFYLEKLFEPENPEMPSVLSKAEEERLYRNWCNFLHGVKTQDTWVNFLNRIIKI